MQLRTMLEYRIGTTSSRNYAQVGTMPGQELCRVGTMHIVEIGLVQLGTMPCPMEPCMVATMPSGTMLARKYAG